MSLRELVEDVLQEINRQFSEIVVTAVEYVASGRTITDPFGVQSMGAPDGTQFLVEFLFLMVVLAVGVAFEKYLDQYDSEAER